MTSKRNVVSLDYVRAKKAPTLEQMADGARARIIETVEKIHELLPADEVQEISLRIGCRLGTIFVSLGSDKSIRFYTPT
jgi:hypothetical protein